MIEFRHIELTFWVLFILIPIFTGLLAYDWQPNEAYNKNEQEILSSHEVCRDVGEAEDCGQMVDVWRDKQTGRIYTRQQFAAHRYAERWRMLYADFCYGLIGCLFFGYARWRTQTNGFYEAVGKAALVNLAVVAVMFLTAPD
jgi:hypothetical protein